MGGLFVGISIFGMRESKESQKKGSDSGKQDSLITLLSESGNISNYRTVIE